MRANPSACLEWTRRGRVCQEEGCSPSQLDWIRQWFTEPLQYRPEVCYLHKPGKKHGRQEKLCDERMIYAAQISRTDGLLANERAVSGCWGCAVYMLPVLRARGGGMF